MFRANAGVVRGFRFVLFGLVVVLTVLAVLADPADARHRRRHATVHKGGGYNPPYAAIVMDGNSGKILHESSADSLRHPASLTKIMTLYLLFERLDAGKIKLSTPMTVSEHAAAQAPSKLGIQPDNTITVEDAIRALVTKSANDVAVVIAETIGGSENEFAALMTKKARALGMSRTVYRNASGLPDDEQVTTARDQAQLGRAIQDRFPQYYRYFATSSFSYRGNAIRNHNHLLGRVEGVDGIKTGYTRASGFNLVTSVRRSNRHVVAVVLGGSSAGARDARMRELIEKNIKEAAVKRTAPIVAEGSTPPEPKSRSAAVPAIAGFSLASVSAWPAPAPAESAKPAQAPAVSRETRETVVTVRTEPGSSAPLKPITVKTVKVKFNTVHSASLAPPAIKIVPANADVANAPATQQTTTAAAAPVPPTAIPPAPVPEPTVAAAPPPVKVAAVEPVAPVAAAPVKVAAVEPVAPVKAIEPAAITEPVVQTGSISIQAKTVPSARPEPAPTLAASAERSTTTGKQNFALAAASSQPTPTSVALSARQSEPTTAAMQSGWIIQVGAFDAEGEAQQRLNAAQSMAKDILAHASAFTQPVTKGDKTLYRARFAGLDKDGAEAACKHLKRADIACMAIKN